MFSLAALALVLSVLVNKQLMHLQPHRNYKIELVFNAQLLYLLIAVASGIALVSYLEFGNSLRAVDGGSKGRLGAIAYFGYGLAHCLVIVALLTNRQRALLCLLPSLVLLANGTFGWLFLLATVAMLISARFRLSVPRLVLIAPISFLLVLAGVFYSKSTSVESLIALFETDYSDTVGSLVAERLSIFHYITSYELQNPKDCEVLPSLLNEYAWGLERLGFDFNFHRGLTFSQCVYEHYANHKLQDGTGLSLGFLASFLAFDSFVASVIFISLMAVILTIVQAIATSVYADSNQRNVALLLLVVFFVPMFDSPVDSFVIFQVSGLKLFLVVAFLIFSLRSRRAE